MWAVFNCTGATNRDQRHRRSVYRKKLIPISTPPDLVSSTDGKSTGIGNAVSKEPFISGNGTYVVFTSTATNLVTGYTGATGVSQIYLKNMANSVITLISSKDGTVDNRGTKDSNFPQISDDGQFVAFQSAAPNLVTGATGTQIFWQNLAAPTASTSGGLRVASSTDSAAVDQSLVVANANSDTGAFVDGHFIAFISSARTCTRAQTGAATLPKAAKQATAPLVCSADGAHGDSISDRRKLSGNVSRRSLDCLRLSVRNLSVANTALYMKDLGAP